MLGIPLELDRLMTKWCLRLAPGERMWISSKLFETERILFESSLPPGLSEYARKRRITEHFYGTEFANRVFPVEP
jgi:hypothetical protein